MQKNNTDIKCDGENTDKIRKKVWWIIEFLSFLKSTLRVKKHAQYKCQTFDEFEIVYMTHSIGDK